jgi:hypothetical protein
MLIHQLHISTYLLTGKGKLLVKRQHLTARQEDF